MDAFNRHYDFKLAFKYGFWLVAFFLACKVTGSWVYPILIPIALIHVSKRKFEELYFVVLIAISSIVCGPWFMPKPMIFGLAQRGLLVMLGFFLLMMLAGQRNAPAVGPMRVFLVYVFYMVFVSLGGWSPIISGLKLFLFFAIFLSFYATTNGVALQKHGMRQLRSMVLAVVGYFLVGSVLVIPFPAIGQMGYEQILAAGGELPLSLFQGVTVHSQTLGPIVAICGVLLFGDLVFSIQRMDRLYVLLLATVPLLIVKTSSRTAMGGFLAGVFFIFWCASRARTVKKSWRSRLLQSGLLAGALFSVILLAIPSTRESIARFVVKYGEKGERVQLTGERVLSSRQGKLDDAIYNWKKSPMFGNGFQVSADMQGFQATSLASIMTAPVEKSTWIYAILEEGGVIGEFLFCLIALYIMTTLVRRRAYIGASCFFTMLVLNLGEFSMFSLSGVGGFIWGVVFVACAMDARRERERLAHASVPPAFCPAPVFPPRFPR